MEAWLLPVHAAATWFMVGLIAFVQVVHYPLFAQVSGEASPAYARLHQRRTSWVVVPAMTIEALSAGLLVLRRPDEPRLWIGLVLLAIVWGSTALLQVPCHRRLARGHDVATIRRLVRGNRIRTAAWVGRGLLVLSLV